MDKSLMKVVHMWNLKDMRWQMTKLKCPQVQTHNRSWDRFDKSNPYEIWKQSGDKWLSWRVHKSKTTGCCHLGGHLVYLSSEIKHIWHLSEFDKSNFYMKFGRNWVIDDQVAVSTSAIWQVILVIIHRKLPLPKLCMSLMNVIHIWNLEEIGWYKK